MTTQNMASPANPNAPLKVDALQLIFFLFGAPHIYGALRSGSNQRRKFVLPAYLYLVPLAAAIAGGIEFLMM